MANPISNFSRAPAVRFFAETCAIHGEVDGSEVEQFDGSMLVRTCKRCMWEALNLAPRGSDSRGRADCMPRGRTPQRSAHRLWSHTSLCRLYARKLSN